MADPRVLFGETRLPQFLGGRRVDYYIPPEVRQGIGALLQVGDMLNPVSAYREYIRDVGEGDVAGAATNLAGFVAPGAAGAVASRLGRSGIRAIEPYSDDAARALMEMLSPTGAPEGIRAYHGSPHTFDRFDMSKVGTGEGAQAYGRGLYFAESEDVARGYRDRISLNKNQFDIVDRRTGDSISEGTPGYKAVKDFLDAYAYDLKRGDISHKKQWWAYQIPVLEKRLKEYEDYAASTGDFEGFKDEIARIKAEIADYIAAPELVDRVRAAPRGSMYEVMIDANPEDFLDWDKPFESADELERFAARFDAIDPVLRKRIEDYGYLRQQMGQPLPDGNDIIREIMGGIGGANAVRATEVMREAGIPGIRYLDAGSRGVGEGSRNYVVFDDRLINIVRVYGIGGAAALLGVSAADVEQALAEVGPSSYRDGGLVSLLPM